MAFGPGRDSMTFVLNVRVSAPYPCRDNEARVDRQTIARVGVDDDQDAQLPARRKLIMDKIHRPKIVSNQQHSGDSL